VHLYVDLTAQGSTPAVPDDNARRVKLCDLFTDTGAALRGVAIPAKDRDREVRTELESFPDVEGILGYLRDQGFRDETHVECNATDTTATIEVRARDFVLPADQVSRLEELFEGEAPNTESEARVTGFVL
jgi:hypothetical protein